MTGARGQRLFFALYPPPVLATALHELARQLPAGARIHPAGQLHLTLAFLGMADAGQRGVAEAIAGALRPSAFELLLDRLGCFEPAAVVWAGCSAPPAALLTLMADLRCNLQAAGLPVDVRTPLPHVTLARKLRSVPALAPPKLRWRVRELYLCASIPTPSGVQYQQLARWPLGPPCGPAGSVK